MGSLYTKTNERFLYLVFSHGKGERLFKVEELKQIFGAKFENQLEQAYGIVETSFRKVEIFYS